MKFSAIVTVLTFTSAAVGAPLGAGLRAAAGQNKAAAGAATGATTGGQAKAAAGTAAGNSGAAGAKQLQNLQAATTGAGAATAGAAGGNGLLASQQSTAAANVGVNGGTINTSVKGLGAATDAESLAELPQVPDVNSATDQAAAFNVDVANVNNAIQTIAASQDPTTIQNAASRGFIFESDEDSHRGPLSQMAGNNAAAADANKKIQQFTPDVLSGFQDAMTNPANGLAAMMKVNSERNVNILPSIQTLEAAAAQNTVGQKASLGGLTAMGLPNPATGSKGTANTAGTAQTAGTTTTGTTAGTAKGVQGAGTAGTAQTAGTANTAATAGTAAGAAGETAAAEE